MRELRPAAAAAREGKAAATQRELRPGGGAVRYLAGGGDALVALARRSSRAHLVRAVHVLTYDLVSDP